MKKIYLIRKKVSSTIIWNWKDFERCKWRKKEKKLATRWSCWRKESEKEVFETEVYIKRNKSYRQVTSFTTRHQMLMIVSRSSEDGFYYSGKIIKQKDSRHYVIDFDEGSNACVASRHVITRSGAVSCPTLKVMTSSFYQRDIIWLA